MVAEQLGLGDDLGRLDCARCRLPLAGMTWEAVDPRAGKVVEVCAACAHHYERKRQRPVPR